MPMFYSPKIDIFRLMQNHNALTTTRLCDHVKSRLFYFPCHSGISMDLLHRLIPIFVENGCVAVFIALMICGAGLPLPEDITLVAGGVIAGLGSANVHA